MAHQAFHGTVPDDFLYDTRHDMWVKCEGETALIGITSFGVFLAGEIIAFTSKPKGAEIDSGRGFGTVESAKTVLAVHAPIAFTLIETNEALEAHPEPINSQADTAWLVRARPRDWAQDSTQLVDAAAYRAHILSVEPEARFK